MSWLDEGQCSTCKHCSMDMDLEPFCTQETVLAKHPYGLNINHAVKDYCGETLVLREER